MWEDNGFIADKRADVPSAMDQLAQFMILISEGYSKFTEDELRAFPAPGKWSRKQLLGHLIDSAVNNLKRFTDAQLAAGAYTIQSYNQEELVVLNNYQEVPAQHLVNLWQSLNQQIIYVCSIIPDTKLNHPVEPGYNKTGTKNLAWLICDYVEHMRHHLGQVRLK